jgi:benzoyl-CoA 2,3-epoxidase subunit A
MIQSTNFLIRQHLIDPEICIRCGTCEILCLEHAISYDGRIYVVDPDKCSTSKSCIITCPTGAIDHWHLHPASEVYNTKEQMRWTSLPSKRSEEKPVTRAGAVEVSEFVKTDPPKVSSSLQGVPLTGVEKGATQAPWSAARPSTNLFNSSNPAIATVTGNMRVTDLGEEYDTHHVVLDLGATYFPVLEGQSIGIIPPGLDSFGKQHYPRQYSISSARNGERAGFNNLSLTIKRVVIDREGKPVKGVASNYMCDLQIGDKVKVTGPFGTSFLMPNHPGSHIIMICTGTGSAPMRGMLHWRNRQIPGGFISGRLMLFFGARTRKSLPFFGRLQNLPKDFLDLNLAFSREPEQPKRYVQDLMIERWEDLAPLLADPDSFFYISGLRGMEEGVVQALQEIALKAGFHWKNLEKVLKRGNRLHLETY